MPQYPSLLNGFIKPTLQDYCKDWMRKSLKFTYPQCHTHRKCSRNGKHDHHYDHLQYVMLFYASFPLFRLFPLSRMSLSLPSLNEFLFILLIHFKCHLLCELLKDKNYHFLILYPMVYAGPKIYDHFGYLLILHWTI